MQSVGQLLQSFLRSARVPPASITEAVGATAAEIWPGIDSGAVTILAFRKGVLHLALDHQARTAEARSFLAGQLRERINEHLGRAVQVGPYRESFYVTKIVFHVPGGR